MQDFELESLSMGAEHSQKVKAAPIESDSGSKDCVDLASSTAKSRFRVPKWKKRAVNLLTEAANYYAVAAFYLYDTLIAIEMRVAARRELQKLIHEPDIRQLFQKMVQHEPLIQLKFDLMNALEGIHPYKSFLLETIHYKPEYYKDVSLSALKGLIQSEETAKPLRVVALRHLADYFFRGVEKWEIEFYDMETNGYGPDLLINNAIRKELFLFLKELTDLHRIKDADIAQEAQRVYGEILKHLQALDQPTYPIQEIAEEASSLLLLT
jgi:hypothetical protein